LTASTSAARGAGPTAPEPQTKIPVLVLWGVPILLVLTYVFLVSQFFHTQARWTRTEWIVVTELLVIFTAIFSLIWFGAAYFASILFGEYASIGVLKLVTKIPKLNRHVIIAPPHRADTRGEVWGRFGILLLITLGYELIFMLTVVKRGDLAPHLAILSPIRFLGDEALVGFALGLLIAPAAPFLASRVKLRITDSLEFPFLWLALLLLVVGGASALEYQVLPGFVFDPSLFLTSILLYAPAAWYVALAFSRAENHSQNSFLGRAWKARGERFHFGRVQVIDVPDGTATDV